MRIPQPFLQVFMPEFKIDTVFYIRIRQNGLYKQQMCKRTGQWRNFYYFLLPHYWPPTDKIIWNTRLTYWACSLFNTPCLCTSIIVGSVHQSDKISTCQTYHNRKHSYPFCCNCLMPPLLTITQHTVQYTYNTFPLYYTIWTQDTIYCSTSVKK
jgi:hypothetical protein